MAGMTSAGGSATGRIAWVDAARGLAIVLVVIYHAAQQAVLRDLSDPAWMTWMQFLRTLRMPLFFVAAGLFAAKWLRRPWGDLLRSKVAVLLWAYAVWAVIRFGILSLAPGESAETGSLYKLIDRAWWPQAGWFLYVLALYFILAKLTQRIPVAVQLAVAAVLSAVWLSGLVEVGNHAWDGAPSYLLFFLIGCHLRQTVMATADRMGPALIVAAILLWVSCYVLVVTVLGWAEVPGLMLTVSVLAVVAGIGAARAVEGSRVLRHLGSRTLPIYVVHGTFFVGVTFAIDLSGIPLPPVVRLALPILLTVAGVLAGLLVQKVADRWAPWLLTPPRALVARRSTATR